MALLHELKIRGYLTQLLHDGNLLELRIIGWAPQADAPKTFGLAHPDRNNHKCLGRV